jgi:uncharacterized protein (DUF58 family)
MLSGRGFLVLGTGLLLWLAARIAGSPTLHMVAVGLVVLPLVALFFSRRGRHRVTVRRRLSEVRASPGQRVTVEIEVENHSSAATSFLLVEDRAPSTLGRPARLVLPGIPARGRQRVSYTIVPHTRGRYVIGPLTVDVSDAFSLTRLRMQDDQRDELLVTPEVEPLAGGAVSPFGAGVGTSSSRALFRTGEEFYTMRQYQTGDDLRRLHWPSVARSGELMIRQDESSRRSTAVLFLDTRASALGQVYSVGLERAISALASIGVLLARSGFSLRLATEQFPVVPVAEGRLLETLASIEHSHSRSLSTSLTRLRAAAAADVSLVAVTAPPASNELTSLIRSGTAFGPKVAVLVYPTDPATLPPDRQAHLEGRASVARLSLSRAGWEVVVLSPSGRLRDLWQANLTRRPALNHS